MPHYGDNPLVLRQSSEVLHEFVIPLHPVTPLRRGRFDVFRARLLAAPASLQTQGSTPNDLQQPRPKRSTVAKLMRNRPVKRIAGREGGGRGERWGREGYAARLGCRSESDGGVAG